MQVSHANGWSRAESLNKKKFDRLEGRMPRSLESSELRCGKPKSEQDLDELGQGPKSMRMLKVLKVRSLNQRRA